MKILMLNYEFPPIGGGGGQAHLALLQQYAQRSDLEVDVLTSAPTPGIVAEHLAGNVRVFKVGIHKQDLHYWRRAEVLEWLRKATRRYRAMLAEQHYDLAHAFFGFPTGWLCYRTARRLPYIISLRGSDVPGENARLQLEYKILGPLVFKPVWCKAAVLVACSEGLKARALRFLPSANIQAIPNGVDLERFHPAGTGSDSDVFRLLTVGRLSVTKRLPLLLEMMGHLRRQGLKTHLTVVGGGALEGEFRQLLGERNLRDIVTLAGRKEGEQMPEIYRTHDVFVSASMQEGMSNAMLEAMACGLPIVTTRCEGVEELIADNGIVVDTPGPGELAEAVRSLVKDRPMRDRMATAARTRASLFSWSTAADRYIEQYRRVLGH